MPVQAPTHLISRVADPIFALFIGLSAAAMRINREEKDKGHSTQETLNAGFKRLGFPRAGDTKADKKN